MRVLFVTPWYPTASDPVHGTFVREHARAAALRHDIRVLHDQGVVAAPGSGWLVTREERDTDPIVHRVGVRRPRMPKTSYIRTVHGVVHAARSLGRNGFRPDLVHAHTYAAGPAAALLAANWRVPYVVSEHLSAFPRGTLGQVERTKARLAFARAAAVLPVSRFLGDALGVPYRTVDNAVDTGLFFPGTPDPAPRLLFVGSLLPVKGLDLLFDALGQVRDLPWHLDVVGRGPLRAQCGRWATERGVADRTTFHGTLDKAAVADLMRRSGALLLASETETQSCASIEAMASGTPVVAPAVGGLPEIVPPNAGILTERTAGALAAGLREVLVGRAFDRAAIARYAAGRFSLDAVGRALDVVYEEVVR